MPVRIYAFAKQLELDNKQLLDICEKVGIKGKGSALASLDDDEIAKIKSFMDGAGSNGSSAPAPPAPGKAKPAPPPAPMRDMSPVRKGPLRDLDSIKKRNKSNKEAAIEKIEQTEGGNMNEWIEGKADPPPPAAKLPVLPLQSLTRPSQRGRQSTPAPLPAARNHRRAAARRQHPAGQTRFRTRPQRSDRACDGPRGNCDTNRASRDRRRPTLRGV